MERVYEEGEEEQLKIIFNSYCIIKKHHFIKNTWGTFLAVQWLRLHSPNV